MFLIRKCCVYFTWWCYFILQWFSCAFWEAFSERTPPSRIQPAIYLCTDLLFPPEHPTRWCTLAKSPTHMMIEKSLAGNCWNPPKEEDLLRRRIICFRPREWITEKMQEAQLLARAAPGVAAWHADLSVVLLYDKEKHPGSSFFLSFSADTSLC